MSVKFQNIQKDAICDKKNQFEAGYKLLLKLQI